MDTRIPDDLVEEAGTRIVLVVMDGLGGLPRAANGRTELETATTPHLDRLAKRAALGMIDPVAPGVRPGSGPGHLALFGYDPLVWNIGRGVLSALGVGFDLRDGDVAARLNFATIDAEGRVTDRRAGRPSDEVNRRLVEHLRRTVRAPAGVELFLESEKEHRLVLILRGEGLEAELSDTDPQETGVPALPVRSLTPEAERTAGIVQDVLAQMGRALRDEEVANGVLARGFAAYRRYPSFAERYRLRALAIARYPMYRGVARLVGMDVHPGPASDDESVTALTDRFQDHDFHFIHFKAIDSRGEDGDFDAKVAAIEAVDALMPRIEALEPDVLLVTGDHSTPAPYRQHSWHPVPVLLASRWVRTVDVDGFGERACTRGELGRLPAHALMTLALAHADRLAKYGA
ncbi:MAG: 2,3-bisphosphoglycerate-independent phosphoglycerate mutase [Longimicrobiales bacterium]